MPAVLLDTQVVILACLGEPLPKKVRTLLSDPETERLFSAASLVEIAIEAAGKLAVSAADIQSAVRDLALTMTPFRPEHALRLFTLPTHHGDPFDRMIIAAALGEGVPLVSGDQQFKRYAGLKLIWR